MAPDKCFAPMIAARHRLGGVGIVYTGVGKAGRNGLTDELR